MPDLHETINQFLEGSIASIGRDPVIESKSITANGTYTAPEGVDGYSPITVNVPTPTPVIESKSITANGTYTAPEGVDGYSPITVNVPLPTNAYILKSVTTPTPIASFSDGEEMVMPTLKVAIEPQQEGSGDPSPTNIRPISGWSEANVTVADATTDPTVSNIYTIDLDGTRYGGTLDVVSGVLTVNRAYVDLGTLNWTAQTDSQGTYFRSSKPNNMKSVQSGVIPNVLCSIYPITVSSNVYDGSIAFSVGSEGYTFVRDTRFTDATAFKTAMSGVQLVYELATPLTIQLTPTAVKSLLGSNNVWADTGDITDAEYFSKEV